MKYPNELGLYDLSGNVWEWCQDQWHDNYEGAPRDGSVWEIRDAELRRVLRGGSWVNAPKKSRVAYRSSRGLANRSGNFGFRLALTMKPAV